MYIKADICSQSGLGPGTSICFHMTEQPGTGDFISMTSNSLPSRLDDSSPQWKLSSAHIPCPPTPPAHHKATRAFLWLGGGGESEETGPVALACPHNFIVTQLICLRGVQKSEDTCSLLDEERKKNGS